jgi:hypothetical protein
MFLKKSDPSLPEDDKTVCSILINILPEHSVEEALDLLKHLDAENIEELAPSFMSAKVKKHLLPQLQTIAQVEIKQPYQMRQK